ncbi:MAG: chitobiase/beta-hexosaminidase C-terminal domain-containing protein [Treponema sp.]|nr:chitobiase/beta-hexosaminidase C-terminal domain-containing protein [Candidatus Treponema caballi]
MKRTLLKVLFLLSVFSGLWALPFQGTVISPVAGNWENAQPLIIEKADKTCEVYYSLSGADPLISGFAYDGPVMLEGTGVQKLMLVSVSDAGISDVISITYSSNAKPAPSYIPQDTRDVYIRITDKTHIPMPDSARWAAGVSANQKDPESSAFHSGGELSLNGRCDEPRILPLIISTSQGFYRYLLRTGIEAPSLPAPVAQYTGIEFSQWNYIRFNNGRTSLYSIDGGPWQQTKKPVFIDRTEEHTVSWKELKPVTTAELEEGYADEGTQTMVLPAKPEFNLPEKSWTGGSLFLSFPSEDFVFEYEDEKGRIHYQNSWGMATVPGDSEGIKENFTIYYKGLKQGTMDVSVLINRRIPEGPEIVPDTNELFSRTEVVLKFHSADTVYYKVTIPENRPYGFDFATDDIEGMTDDELNPEGNNYMRLADGEIVLGVNPDSALLYRVTAYSEDVSGNRSDLTQYAVVVDGTNLYVADEPSFLDAQYVSSAQYGSMNNPCKSLGEAVQIAERNGFLNPRVFISGTHTLKGQLSIAGNLRLIGKQNARIICPEDSEIIITDGFTSISGITLEKRETPLDEIYCRSLVTIQNASLSLYDCELYADFSKNGIVINADNSSINIKKCGITTRAQTYTALVSAHGTKLFMYNVRGVASAPTAVGISAEGGMSYLADSSLSVIASLGRIAEYVDLSWVLEACSLRGNNTIPVESAIWTDENSILLSDKANSYSGFSKLWIRAEK